MKTRNVSIKYIEKEIDLSLLIKNIVEELVNTTSLKEK